MIAARVQAPSTPGREPVHPLPRVFSTGAVNAWRILANRNYQAA